jgi:hypothetical protein
MDIPTKILDAADLVANWMTMNGGGDNWRFCGIAARAGADRAETELEMWRDGNIIREEDKAELDGLSSALADMVAVAESQGWNNAEIHNARHILSNAASDRMAGPSAGGSE